MKLAYVDTSCLVAIVLGEPGATAVESRFRKLDRLFASNLLEAELRSTLVREDVRIGDGLLSQITWVFPDRPLTGELLRITSLGYLKGADLWHLACALFLQPDPQRLVFLTLDKRQGEIAEKLGFAR